ncbi:MAG: dTDP-4-dehydrorhamnose 3,5-epimerase [Gammaproteobacteria bacterium]|nr:dTDP-4-dehydrorhamnose 3,5-epimerase [Gammaproteobacteria bacterium]
MKVVATKIPQVLVFEPDVHGDDRGFFMETWRRSEFEKLGIDGEFVQDNQSKSRQGILRGLHYQLQKPQGKLVRAIAGEIFDVAVDLRKSSPTFCHWVGEILSAQNHRQLWVPPGFAHGFYVLSESAEIVYKCTQYYAPEDDRSLLWNDKELSIDWPLLDSAPELSDKDKHAVGLDRAELFP